MSQLNDEIVEEISVGRFLEMIEKKEKADFLILGSPILNQPMVDVSVHDARHLARQYSQTIKDVKLYVRSPFGPQRIKI